MPCLTPEYSPKEMPSFGIPQATRRSSYIEKRVLLVSPSYSSAMSSRCHAQQATRGVITSSPSLCRLDADSSAASGNPAPINAEERYTPAPLFHTLAGARSALHPGHCHNAKQRGASLLRSRRPVLVLLLSYNTCNHCSIRRVLALDFTSTRSS